MKPCSIVTFLLSSLCSLCLCGESSAIDAETKTPYTLKVVLHFADHRLLTDVFRDRVARELHDGLQASFGALVNVSVEGEDPHLKEVLENGLRSLDGWRERSAVKTHFVLIDYSGVHYTIQARQFDGLTGTPGPVVRRDRTRDRDFVAKAAALLVEQDFGLTGVFDRWPDTVKETPGEDKPVTVDLKGAGLSVPLDRWIKKGDVFAVVQMPSGDAAPGKPVPDALLLVDAPPSGADTSCVCRVFRRYAPPRDAGGGYRCIRLGTVTAPLRLRLLQAMADGESGPLQVALNVQIRRTGFNDDAGVIRKSTDNADTVDTTSDKNNVPSVEFDHVAFVSVFSAGNQPQARVPVALLDDQPVVLRIAVADDANSLQAFRRNDWQGDVTAAWLEQTELFREINEWAADPKKRAETMKKIQEGVKRSRDDFKRLNEERQELAKSGPLDVGSVDKLTKINDGATELTGFLDRLQKIDAEENDPKKKQWLARVEQGKQLEKALEIDKALAAYDQVLKEGYQDDKLKAYAEDLRQKWTPKSEEHRKARAFLYEVWPTLDDEGLKAKLDEAKAAVETCKKGGDWRALTKFLAASATHVARMTQEVSALRPDINTGDEMQVKFLKEVNEAVAPLIRDVDSFVKTMDRSK